MSVDLHHPTQDNIINRQNKESTLKGGESSSMPPENKNWLHSKQAKIIASVATLSILATIGVENLLNNKSDKATSPTNKTAVTDTLNPGETQKLPAISNEVTTKTPAVAEVTKPTAETLPTVGSLELDASLFSDPNALIEEATDKSDRQWANAGATPENAKAALKYKEGLPAYAKKIASEYDEIFIKALLVDNWESKPALVEWIKNVKLIHQEVLRNYFYTSFPEVAPNDKVPYMRASKITKIVSSTDNKNNTISITLIQHDYDNADLNRVGNGQLNGGVRVQGNDVEPTLTFLKKDGKIKIYDIILRQGVQ